MREPRIGVMRQLRLQAIDFFRDGLQPREVFRWIPVTTRVVGDHSKSFAQSIGKLVQQFV